MLRLNKLINDYRQGNFDCSKQIEELVKNLNLKQNRLSASNKQKYGEKYSSPYKAI